MALASPGSSQVSTRVEPVELLALALTFMDPNENYTADAGTWSAALLELKPVFMERYPDLFGRLGFREGFRAKPYSPAVSEFLTRMQLALAVGVGNPEYAVLNIDEEAQRRLREPYEADARYARSLDAARELAQALRERQLLAPPKSRDLPPESR
jgi:hypothetical protein